MKQLIILNYHDFETDDTPVLRNPYSLRQGDFLRQLDCIKDAAIPIVNLSQWLEKESHQEQLSIALTFDDGYVSHYNFVFPELLKRNISATFFPTVSMVGKDNYVNWNQLREMTDSAFQIGTHGQTHKRLPWLSSSNLHIETVISKEIMQRELGRSIKLFSLPFGTATQRTFGQLKREYRAVLTTGSRVNRQGDFDFTLHRFNIKNSLNIQHFQQLIKSDPLFLFKRRMASSLALMKNQCYSVINIFRVEP